MSAMVEMIAGYRPPAEIMRCNNDLGEISRAYATIRKNNWYVPRAAYLVVVRRSTSSRRSRNKGNRKTPLY